MISSLFSSQKGSDRSCDSGWVNGLYILPKVSAVSDWPKPTTAKEVHCFVGFVNFYRTLIDDFARLCQPLTALLKKNVRFQWGEKEQKAFESIKAAFTKETFLSHPDESKPFVVETDASDFPVAGILSQFDEKNVLKPVAYYSKQLDKSERNYEIYDKELYAIVNSFQNWRHYLQGGSHTTLVLWDHKNLEYFMTTKKLTRRQARWSLTLAEFNFVISHIPGATNRSDLLSRRPDYQIKDACENLIRIIRDDQVLNLNRIIAERRQENRTILHSDNLDMDIDLLLDWPLLIADYLQSDSNTWLAGIPRNLLSKCKKELNRFELKDDRFVRIGEDAKSLVWYLPHDNRVEVIQHYHENLAHLKHSSVIDIIKDRYWWPDLNDDIKDVIARCLHCQLNASNSSVEEPTPLTPLPPVPLPFERWGIDFVQDLPTTLSGNKHIITAIDYATRWVVAKAVPNREKDNVISFYTMRSW